MITLRILKWGFVNFWRNSLLSVAATLVMTLALLTISISTISNLVVNATVESINQKLNLVVYFTDKPTESDLDFLAKEVSRLEHVDAVKYIDKDTAATRFQSLDVDKRLKDIATKQNRLPRSFEISLDNPANTATVEQFFQSGEHSVWVEDTSFNRNQAKVDRLTRITKFIRIGGIAFSVIFVLISILIIYNTIRLTIFTRRDEIEIMKLVGASISFIRWPFLIEGMLYGLIATMISTVLIYTAFYLVSPSVSSYFGADISALKGSLISFVNANLWIIVLLELGIGMIITSVSSIFAMKKYLRV
jgi:cell division transport system permease protein